MRKVLPDHAIVIPDEAVRVFKGEIFDVYQWPQQLFDGSTATFEMLRRPDTVLVIGIKDGQLIMVQDEQPNRKSRLTFPGGRADRQEETWLQAAQREMREETGLSFKHWKLVAVEQPLSKIEQFVAWFVATDVTSEVPQQLDAGEKITVELQSFEAVKTAVITPDGHGPTYAVPLFLRFDTFDELAQAPPFKGQEVDR